MRARVAAAVFATLILGGAASADETSPPANTMLLLNPARLEDLSLAAITVCNGDTQWTPPIAMAPETNALAGATGVRRSGRTLTVGRARFRNINFNADQTEGVAYTYVGRYAAAPIALVRVVYFEGDGWIMVDPATGAQQDLATFPLPGPDGRSFVSASLENEYDDTALTMVEWHDGKLTETRLEVKFPCGLAWDGPDAVTFWLKTGAGNDPAVDWKPARLIRVNGVWTIEGP